MAPDVLVARVERSRLAVGDALDLASEKVPLDGGLRVEDPDLQTHDSTVRLWPTSSGIDHQTGKGDQIFPRPAMGSSPERRAAAERAYRRR
jgi:hypothetical protein